MVRNGNLMVVLRGTVKICLIVSSCLFYFWHIFEAE